MKETKRPTRDRILDSAEQLFAQKGFEGVSVRQIMNAAEADVSLAYYHFKSKRDLFDQVMLRKADHFNEIRLQALDTVEERHSDDEPTVEEIIGAFTDPLLDLLAENHDEWKHYFQHIAQINNSPEWGGELMTRYFDPLVLRFIDALRKALPNCEEEGLYWSYHFLSGALTLTFAETGRIDNLSNGICRSTDISAQRKRMPRFLAAGFLALSQRNSS